MQPTMTPLLLVAELGYLFLLAVRSGRLAPIPGTMVPVHVFLVWLTAYGVATTVLGARGVYVADEMMRLLPGFWLQLITVSACVLPVLLFVGVRQGLRRIVDSTPWHWFAYFHGLRIAAIGSVYKAMIGEFPDYFAVLVGIPDLLFGLSAFWVAGRAKRGDLAAGDFILWNLIGALVIVPAAPVLLQLGLPGPLQLFTGQPDARAVFTYPMSIAPMIGVPLFVLVNLWVAWRLWERSHVTTGTA